MKEQNNQYQNFNGYVRIGLKGDQPLPELEPSKNNPETMLLKLPVYIQQGKEGMYAAMYITKPEIQQQIKDLDEAGQLRGKYMLHVLGNSATNLANNGKMYTNLFANKITSFVPERLQAQDSKDSLENEALDVATRASSVEKNTQHQQHSEEDISF